MSDCPKILVITGPNLNMLGVREPSIYGVKTLRDIEDLCDLTAKELGVAISFRQSNHEGEIVTWIQEVMTGDYDGIVINGAAYSHTSVAIMDALKMADVPIIEVHLSNVFAREDFRHHSYISCVATGLICGLGGEGYGYAIRALAEKIQL
ncbi:MAG: type II 3-dehydroquinate dehydratase [Alphaproteobacteria bacterium]|nr:type II 3-dehydroquinate dehydratase [Alphaproteobacteria bacterium]